MIEKLDAAQRFVKRNKTKILVGTTVVSTTAALLMRSGLKQHNEFLREHDLYDTFYAQIED